MAEFDVLTREFMRNPDVFAEAFNGVIYGGKKVLKPSQLKVYDTTLLHTAGIVNTPGDVVQKDRDVAKIAYTDDQKIYLFLGIENQTSTDYCMPARVMIYDALTYDQQLKSELIKADLHRKQHLVPVITLVCYFGLNPWTGPKTLHEMMGNYPDEILRYVPDYPLNLLDPFHMSNDEIDTFNGELGCVFECLRVHNNSTQLKNLISSDSRFNAISKTAAKLLNYRLQLHIDQSIASQEENINMCKAVQDMIEEATNEYKREAQRANEEAQRANEEAQRANEEAQRANEDAQRANEDAQRANEEAQRANEDAQRAKDEAQTLKDEAQTLKDEAQTLKDEAQTLKDEAQRANTIILKAVASMRQHGQSMVDIATQLDMSLQEIHAICAKA